MYLGNFCKKICLQEHSKNVQSGHAGGLYPELIGNTFEGRRNEQNASWISKIKNELFDKWHSDTILNECCASITC